VFVSLFIFLVVQYLIYFVQIMRFSFAKPLSRAKVISRPNRFLMNIEINGEVHLAHCPTTGRIGNIDFSGSNIPCLYSESAEGSKRKTKFSVEAISIQNDLNLEDVSEWIGINQTKVNSFIKYFLQNGKLGGMVGAADSNNVRSEVSIGRSRLDFVVGNHALEIKMPLAWLTTPDRIKILNPTKSKPDHNRLIKHFGDLSNTLTLVSSDGSSSSIGDRVNQKALIALVYMYDAAPFVRPSRSGGNNAVLDAATAAAAAGVESWQINLKIDPTGVELQKYFRLNFEE
jgi:sugar fermentation stimulation protein A